jgi:hypothetical protein
MIIHRRDTARGLPLALVCLYALAGSVPGIATPARAARYGQAPPQVYTVGQVLAGVRHCPHHWLGRTILVRGIVSGYLTDYPQPGPALAPRAPGLWLYDPTATVAATPEAYLTTLLPWMRMGSTPKASCIATSRAHTALSMPSGLSSPILVPFGLPSPALSRASSWIARSRRPDKVPFIGALLDRRFPRDGAMAPRIHLSSAHTYASPPRASPSGPCVDGIVQG